MIGKNVNFINKFIVIVLFILTIALVTVGQNNVFAADKDEQAQPVMPEQVRIDSDNFKSDEEKKQSEDGEEPKEGGKNASLEDDSVWNIYAQLLMTTQENEKKDKEEEEEKKNAVHRAFDGTTAGIMGDGGITLNVPYNKMNSDANKIRGNESKEEKDNSGSQMASFLSTYSSYGYIDTNSGQKQLNSAGNKMSGALKNLFGVIVAFALVINFVMSKILDWLVYALVDLNPLTLLGLGDVKISEDNPVAKGIKSVFDNIGLGDVFDKVQSIGFMIIALMFIFGVIWALTRGDVRSAKTKSRKWLVRLFVAALGIPLLLFISKDLGQTIKDMKSENSANDNIVSQYIVNTRGWAASSNLSPSGLEGYEFPNATAKDSYVDKDFDPVQSRKLIKGINNNTYNTLYPDESKNTGFDLLNKWMDNESFGVNTYIGDINRADLNKDQILPAFEGYKDTFGKKGNEPKLSDIEYSMWSATQNYDEELRNVNSKSFKKASNVGVRDNNSFSTQTVVLLLQSALDNNQAEFYANNLGPTGAQGALKNVTTVKTNWQEVTLPGDGTFGVIGSYFGLGGHAVSYSIITIAAIMALLTVNLLEALVRAAKKTWAVLWHGDGYALLSLAAIIGAGFISVTIALKISDWFIEIIDWTAKIISQITGGNIPSGFIDILANLVMVVLAIVLGFGRKVGKTNYPPVKYIMSIPFQIAFDYDDKISRLSGKDNTDFKGAFSEFGSTFKNGGRANLQDLGNHGKQHARGMYGAVEGAGIGIGQSMKRKGSLKNFGIPNARKSANDAIAGTKYGFNNAYDTPIKEARSNTKNQLSSQNATESEVNSEGNKERYGSNSSLNNVSIGNDGIQDSSEENRHVDRNSLKGYSEENRESYANGENNVTNTSTKESEQRQKGTANNHSLNSTSNQNSEKYLNGTYSKGTDTNGYSNDPGKEIAKDGVKDTATSGAKDVAFGTAAAATGVDKESIDAVSDTADGIGTVRKAGSMSKEERQTESNNNKSTGSNRKGRTTTNVEEQKGSKKSRNSSTQESKNIETQTANTVGKGNNNNTSQTRSNGSRVESKRDSRNNNNSNGSHNNRPRRRRATEKPSGNPQATTQEPTRQKNRSKVEKAKESKPNSRTKVSKEQSKEVNKPNAKTKVTQEQTRTESKQPTRKTVERKNNVKNDTKRRTTTRRTNRSKNLNEDVDTENTYNKKIKRNRRNKK